ncbi:Uncharacterised protein [Bifidobacterium pseudocatenulatum]|nr:Uncharacterised protein [Bifidobacterium pseudocatenulatum]
MRAEPAARGRHHLRAHGRRALRVYRIRHRRVCQADRGLVVRRDHGHGGTAPAGAGAGDRVGRVPWRNGRSRPPRRSWRAVHWHGVHHQSDGNTACCRRQARSATRTTTPWPNPPTARARPSSSGGTGPSGIWTSWSWRRSGGSRGGTRNGCTSHWATGHRKRWKPSIVRIKRRKPPHYKGGTKIRPLQTACAGRFRR